MEVRPSAPVTPVEAGPSQGVLGSRIDLTTAQYNEKYLSMGYEGAVGRVGSSKLTNPETGKDQPVFSEQDSVDKLAADFKRKLVGVSAEDREEKINEWLDEESRQVISEGATFGDLSEKDLELDARETLKDLIDKGIINADETETATKFQEAVNLFTDAPDVTKEKMADYKKHKGIKRGAVAAGRLAKDVMASPGTALAYLQARKATKEALANPEQLAKMRKRSKFGGFLVSAAGVSLLAYSAFSKARGMGDFDYAAETLLDSHSPTPENVSPAAVVASPSASPFESASASAGASSSPSASPSASESLSPSPSASASASPEATTPTIPGEDDVPNQRMLDELKKDEEELIPTTTVGFESDLGKYKHDESGKYGPTTWMGTLEWKTHEAAESQGIRLTSERDISLATDRLQEMLGVNDAKARKLPDNFHIKLTEEQLDKIFDGLGETDTDASGDKNDKGEEKDPSKETGKNELSKEDQARLDAERRKLLEGEPNLGAEQPESTDKRLEMERRKLENDPTFAGTPEIVATPGAVVSPETQPETSGGANPALVAAAGLAAAGVATAAGLAIRNNKKRKKVNATGEPVDADVLDEEDDEDDEGKRPKRNPFDDDELPVIGDENPARPAARIIPPSTSK